MYGIRWREFDFRKLSPWCPYAILASAILFVTLIPPRKSLPQIPDTPRDSMSMIDSETAKFWRETVWTVQKQSSDETVQYERQSLGAGSDPYRPFELRCAKVTSDSVQIYKGGLSDVISSHGVPFADIVSTDMVLVVKFDPEGVGTLDASPIAFNEEKQKGMQEIDRGNCLRGRYQVNAKSMTIYLAQARYPRPAHIPESNAFGTTRFDFERTSDGTLSFIEQRIPEQIPINKPIDSIQLPKLPYKRQPNSALTRLDNGWVVQINWKVLAP